MTGGIKNLLSPLSHSACPTTSAYLRVSSSVANTFSTSTRLVGSSSLVFISPSQVFKLQFRGLRVIWPGKSGACQRGVWRRGGRKGSHGSIPGRGEPEINLSAPRHKTIRAIPGRAKGQISQLVHLDPYYLPRSPGIRSAGSGVWPERISISSAA